MSRAGTPSVHASAVRIGTRAVLIRGPSGAGKSRLAFGLIVAGRSDRLPAAELIGDDRVFLERRDGRLWVRPVPEIAGMIEIRGLGIRRCDVAPEAERGVVVGLVVDLAAGDAARLPDPAACSTLLDGVELPRLPVGAGHDPLLLVVAALTTAAVAPATQLDDCWKDFYNHMSHSVVTG